MKKKIIAFSGTGYNSHYLWTHPWEIVDHYWREFKFFVQRGLYGYSDEDWWSLDDYLVTWLPNALRKYKKAHSYPGVGEAKTPKQWSEIIEKMARGFEAKRKQNDLTWMKAEGFEKKYKKLQKEFEEGMTLFTKYFDNLWD